MVKNVLLNCIEKEKCRSAWQKGVKEYAYELIEELNEETIETLNTNGRHFQRDLLNGAMDWKEFSWGGCSLIYNEDIAKRLCSKSELIKTKNGKLKPNKNEEWLDTQARALFQASMLISKIIEGKH